MSYLAEFEGPQFTLVQGVARFNSPPDTAPDAPLWWLGLKDLLARCGPGFHPAFGWRLIFGPDSFTQVLLLCAPSHDADALRNKLLLIEALNKVIAGSVRLAEDRQEYERLAGQPPGLAARFSATGYAAGAGWLSCRFHLRDCLAALAEVSRLGNYTPVWYQVNVWWLEPQVEHLRNARKNLVRLEEVPGLPGELLERQETLTRCLEAPLAVGEEFLAVPDQGCAARLNQVLRQLLEQAEGRFHFTAPKIDFVAEGIQQQMALGLHRAAFTEVSTEEICAECLSDQECQNLLLWRPGQPGAEAAVGPTPAGQPPGFPVGGWAGASAVQPQPELAPGLRVGNGRFEILRRLGRGGMGEVWLGRDLRLNEPVALKFLPPEIRGDPVALDCLRVETARSHKLTHTHIVRIYDLHEEPDGSAFFTMEYVEGSTLESLRLQQPKRVLTWDFLSPLLPQLLAALDYAHGEKVIHRDLKPSNIMVEAGGRLKLADFGIAAVVSDSVSRASQRGPTSGTLVYMSPQQLLGKRPQVTDDIYALGATLYDLLSGGPPFFTGDIAYQVLHQSPEPLDQRLSASGIENAIPADVADLIMDSLAKEPAQRPQTAKEVGRRLFARDLE